MYIFCELWSVVIINLLFWQYANHIFDTRSAKRFYPILGILGNGGLILAGNVLVAFADISGVADVNIASNYADNINFQCESVLKPIMKVIICAGVLAMVLYRYINHYILKKGSMKRNFSGASENRLRCLLSDSVV